MRPFFAHRLIYKVSKPEANLITDIRFSDRFRRQEQHRDFRHPLFTVVNANKLPYYRPLLSHELKKVQSIQTK